jgi:hypothetical protein
VLAGTGAAEILAISILALVAGALFLRMMAFRLCNNDDDWALVADEMTIDGIVEDATTPPTLAKSCNSRKGAGKMDPVW